MTHSFSEMLSSAVALLAGLLFVSLLFQRRDCSRQSEAYARSCEHFGLTSA
jgi:hypothetical protein